MRDRNDRSIRAFLRAIRAAPGSGLRAAATAAFSLSLAATEGLLTMLGALALGAVLGFVVGYPLFMTANGPGRWPTGASPLRRSLAPVRTRRLWWIAVLGATFAFSVMAVFVIRELPGPSVVRVVGEGGDLWAYTQDRTLLQGGETAWWVSSDAGITWAERRPPGGVADAGPQQEACNALACYRLVDGRVIERRADDSSIWTREQERPVDDTPPADEEYRRGWDEERSVAAAGGVDLDIAAVASGHDGALVRTDDGTWRSVAVGRPWEERVMWWLVGLGWLLLLLGGLTVDLFLRRFTPPPVPNHLPPPGAG